MARVPSLSGHQEMVAATQIIAIVMATLTPSSPCPSLLLLREGKVGEQSHFEHLKQKSGPVALQLANLFVQINMMNNLTFFFICSVSFSLSISSFFLYHFLLLFINKDEL